MNTTPTPYTNTCDASQAAAQFDEAMKLIADFWTLRIVGTIGAAELRFCEIERALPTANPTTLTSRLKRLEEAGIIERLVETRDKQSVTYILTENGRGLLPIVDAIKAYTLATSK